MIRRGGRIPIFLLLLLVLFGLAARIVGGPPPAPSQAGATARAATPAPRPAPAATTAPGVVRSLAAVQRAFNAGDVALLCRSGAIVDPSVIQHQNRRSGGCERQLEELMANEPPLGLAVRQVSMRRDLATAVVTTASGASVPVDLIRQGGRWLLSFSDGDDPMPALAGAA